MPIRFRCAYCNQLMGISRRKAGTIVRCPKCSGQVVVPNPDDQPAEDDGSEFPVPASATAGKNLEDPELDDLLSGRAKEPAPSAPSTGSKPGIPVRGPQFEPFPVIDVEPLEGRAPPAPAPGPLLPPGTVLMPRRLLIGLVTVLLLLLGLAFLIGFLLGKRFAISAHKEASARSRPVHVSFHVREARG